jgi:hypothetical protein
MIRFMEDPNLEVLPSSLGLLHLICRASTWMGIKTPLDLHLDSMEQGTLPEDDFNEAIKDEELKVEDLCKPHEAREDEDLKVNSLGSLTNSEREAMVSSSMQIKAESLFPHGEDALFMHCSARGNILSQSMIKGLVMVDKSVSLTAVG